MLSAGVDIHQILPTDLGDLDQSPAFVNPA